MLFEKENLYLFCLHYKFKCNDLKKEWMDNINKLTSKKIKNSYKNQNNINRDITEKLIFYGNNLYVQGQGFPTSKGLKAIMEILNKIEHSILLGPIFIKFCK